MLIIQGHASSSSMVPSAPLESQPTNMQDACGPPVNLSGVNQNTASEIQRSSSMSRMSCSASILSLRTARAWTRVTPCKRAPSSHQSHSTKANIKTIVPAAVACTVSLSATRLSRIPCATQRTHSALVTAASLQSSRFSPVTRCQVRSPRLTRVRHPNRSSLPQSSYSTRRSGSCHVGVFSQPAPLSVCYTKLCKMPMLDSLEQKKVPYLNGHTHTHTY
jgi:hypothetical protein